MFAMAKKLIFGSKIQSKDGTMSRKVEKETDKFYSGLTEDVAVYPYTKNPTMAWERLQVKQHVERVTPMHPHTPPSTDKLRFVCVSDTHSRTSWMDPTIVPQGDVLLHAGDFTMTGHPKEVEAFNQWLGTLPHRHKIVIAGNHDLMFEESKLETDWVYWGLVPDQIHAYLRSKNVSHVRELLTNCTYLEDAETSVCGIRIYGSPWQPSFANGSFKMTRGKTILEKWKKIPDHADIVMTHGPPIGHGDLCSSNKRAGCVELLHTIQKRVKPKYHVFGHIHEDPGITTDGTTMYMNACTCNISYRPVQPPIIFDLDIPEGHSKDELLNELDVIDYPDLVLPRKVVRADTDYVTFCDEGDSDDAATAAGSSKP